MCVLRVCVCVCVCACAVKEWWSDIAMLFYKEKKILFCHVESALLRAPQQNTTLVYNC